MPNTRRRFPSRPLAGLILATSLLVGLPVAGANASVSFRQATLESGTFAEFDQTNAQAGTLSNSSALAYEGTRSAQATYDGSGANGFSRGILNVNWHDGEDVYFGTAVYLPVGFKSSMQGQVDLMRWDNWTVDPTHTDRSGIVIYGSDKRARLMRWQLGGTSATLVGPFDLPEGQWSWIEVHQRLSPVSGQALSEVWLNGQQVGSSTLANTYGREVTRLRFGLVAMDDGAQTKPLSLHFDRASISPGYIGPAGSEPVPAPAPTEPRPRRGKNRT